MVRDCVFSGCYHPVPILVVFLFCLVTLFGDGSCLLINPQQVTLTKASEQEFIPLVWDQDVVNATKFDIDLEAEVGQGLR